MPLFCNLYQLLRERFPADPDAPWLLLPDGRELSYAQADAASARYAGALKHLGVTAGERVLAQVDKSPEALILYLAVLRLGAAYVPLNTAYTAAEVAYFLEDARPVLFVARTGNQDELAAAAESVAAKLVTLDPAAAGTLPELARATEAVVEIAAVGADDIAAIVYTSGTTGRAKGAMLSHANLASNALTLQTLWGFRADDVLLHALPVYHVHGLFVAVHCAMLAGSPMLFLSKFDALEVLAQLGKATVMMGVPTFYTRLLELVDFDRAACARMRLFISGSAPLRTETWQAFFERTGHQILERYGMSEAGMITSNPLAGERLPGSVGFALPGVTVRVSGEDHQPLPAGEIGMLELTGPNVFKGYWQMPGKTAAEFSDDGFFVSGDLAVMDQSGRVRIVGRDKDLVISGGLNVYPREIEQALDALPGVLESAVIGVPHADLGEGLVAVICAPTEMAPDEASVINALKVTLAGFKMPRRVFRVDALPRNTMGKVQKNVLRETYAGTFTD